MQRSSYVLISSPWTQMTELTDDDVQIWDTVQRRIPYGDDVGLADSMVRCLSQQYAKITLRQARRSVAHGVLGKVVGRVSHARLHTARADFQFRRSEILFFMALLSATAIPPKPAHCKLTNSSSP